MVENAQRMLHTDAFSWYMESDPALRSTVVAVSVTDTEPDWEYLRRRVDRLTRLVPRFRHRVQEPPLRIGPPRWVPDENFDLDFHLRRVRLPRSGGWSAVLEAARLAAMADFDRDRPLWELTVLEGLPGGRAALLQKLHHALSDGIGGVQLLAFLVDPTRQPVPVEEVPVPDGRAPGAAALVAASVRDNVREVLEIGGRILTRSPAALLSPVDTAQAAWRDAKSVARIVRPVLRQASPVLAGRTMTRRLATLDVSLADLHAAAARAGGHVNDAFLAGLTGGLRRYHDAHGAAVGNLRVTMPVSIRKPGDPLGGNRIALLRFGVPAGIEDPGERIARIARTVRSWRREPGIALTQGIAFGLNLAPRGYLQAILRRVDFLASDVPGLSEAVYIAGARIVAYYAFGPTIGAGFNATLMSYAGTCNIGLNIDTGAVPDSDELLRHLHAGFAEVLDLNHG